MRDVQTSMKKKLDTKSVRCANSREIIQQAPIVAIVKCHESANIQPIRRYRRFISDEVVQARRSRSFGSSLLVLLTEKLIIFLSRILHISVLILDILTSIFLTSLAQICHYWISFPRNLNANTKQLQISKTRLIFVPNRHFADSEHSVNKRKGTRKLLQLSALASIINNCSTKM